MRGAVKSVAFKQPRMEKAMNQEIIWATVGLKRRSAAVRAMATVPGCERSVPEARAFVDGVLGRGHPER